MQNEHIGAKLGLQEMCITLEVILFTYCMMHFQFTAESFVNNDT
jgi:hypothetical protein